MKVAKVYSTRTKVGLQYILCFLYHVLTKQHMYKCKLIFLFLNCLFHYYAGYGRDICHEYINDYLIFEMEVVLYMYLEIIMSLMDYFSRHALVQRQQ